jgi:hypothetical protein
VLPDARRNDVIEDYRLVSCSMGRLIILLGLRYCLLREADATYCFTSTVFSDSAIVASLHVASASLPFCYDFELITIPIL